MNNNNNNKDENPTRFFLNFATLICNHRPTDKPFLLNTDYMSMTGVGICSSPRDLKLHLPTYSVSCFFFLFASLTSMLESIQSYITTIIYQRHVLLYLFECSAFLLPCGDDMLVASSPRLHTTRGARQMSSHLFMVMIMCMHDDDAGGKREI